MIMNTIITGAYAGVPVIPDPPRAQYEPGLRRARRNVLAALDELAVISESMPNNDAGKARADAMRACVAAKQALDKYLDRSGDPKYPILCAWCPKGTRTVIGYSTVANSHGICETCLNKQLKGIHAEGVKVS